MIGSQRTRRRVLLVGFDCADVDLVDEWSSSGYMPTCAALRAQGTWRRLETTSSVTHVSAWPTLYTGTSPGTHGISHAYYVRAGEQRIRFADPMHYGQPPFWRYLDEVGRKCIVFDPFACYRLEGFKGVQIQEYGTWTWFSDPCSTPSGLLREIERRFGRYPAPEHTKLVHVPADLNGYRDQLVAGARLKSRIAQALMREHDWDLAFVSFGEAHAAGHYLWHTGDRDFPVQPGEGSVGARHLVREIYAAMDEAIGEMVASVDDDTTVIVMSVDGMGPNYSGSHLIPDLLNKLGLFFSSSVGRVHGRAYGRAVPHGKSLLRKLRAAIPIEVRQSLTRCLPRRLQYWRELRWLNSGIDWSRSRVFSIPSSDEALLRINVSGREPLGIVDAGAEYEELVLRLQEEIGRLVNPQNGRQAAARVISMDAVYPGPRRGDLPDVVAKWDSNARILTELDSPSLGRLRGPAGHEVPPFYTGNHRNVAFAVMRGPSVPENVRMDDGHVRDVAPTLLDLLGVEPPPHFEGRNWA